ncbi:hypothetical protein PDE_08446 [Penicillium oxalicum 114-2]|uniref:Uncharacterized protein n=1 Tax=Penicillium oxalicum (strain 114-2 / CGMCC 5302) TaxID=933388 RepID=S7ZST4_PENO1|nr:hypothetical protein PDE_08446 [Penicillium oxalicum 114-2]
MLLNLGLTADAAAAHSNDVPMQPEPSPTSILSSPPTFSLSSLPFLSALYPKSPSGFASPINPTAADPMSQLSSTSTAVGPSVTIAPGSSAPAKPTGSRSTPSKKPLRPKTAYQFAHPPSHARHKRLRLRPKLLLQVQQVSQTPRPLPVIDVLPSTMYVPRLARKFPAMFRGKHGLCPYDVIIVMSELYAAARAELPEHQASSEDEEDQREVVATICQMLQEDARSKGKAEICLNFGPTWEATPLASGSYEFVAQTDEGVRVMRWALRGGKNRRGTTPSGTVVTEDTKRFTFSVIDPHTRRHPVIASMTRDHLEVNEEFPRAVARSATGAMTPSSAMSVVSDGSDHEMPSGSTDVTVLDDELRTFIIVTGIWVALREGWSHTFQYGDQGAAATGKSPISPSSTKYNPSAAANMDEERLSDRDELKQAKNPIENKRCLSMSSIRRSNSMVGSLGDALNVNLSKRSNSTGAAFMDQSKRRSASAMGGRFKRHSLLTKTGENGRNVVVSRPASLRQNSVEPETLLQPRGRSDHKPDLGPSTPFSEPSLSANSGAGYTAESVSDGPSKTTDSGKTKRRHRLSTLFTIFHRKH